MNQLLAAFIVDVVGYRPEAHLPQKNFTQSISPIDFTRLLCPINSIAPAKTGSPKFISSFIELINGRELFVGLAGPQPITHLFQRSWLHSANQFPSTKEKNCLRSTSTTLFFLFQQLPLAVDGAKRYYNSN